MMMKMNRYLVKISRNYCYEEEVIAKDEDEAEQMVNDKVDKFQLYGSELFDDYNGEVKLIEENVVEE